MSELKIGWAARDVSTTEPVAISGQFYVRISEGIHDPVMVTALALDNGKDYVVFLSADIAVFRSYMIDRIREKVAALCPDLAPEKILASATHTHSAPSTWGDTIASSMQSGSPTPTTDDNYPHDGVEMASNDDYYHFFAQQAAEAICEAWNSRKPGGISYGYGFAVVGHSRRVVYLDDVSKRPGVAANSTHGLHGHAMMYGKTNDDKFSHYEAGADPFVNLLYTFDPSGALTGAVVNVPCPSQNSEGAYKLSASFWNEARVAIREKHGNIFILPQTAAGGDLSPRILHYQQAQARRFKLKYGTEPETIAELNARRDIGERIENAFTETLAWARKDIQTSLPLTHVVKTVKLDRRKISNEEAADDRRRLEELMRTPFKTDGDPIECLKFNSTLVSGRNRCRNALQKYEMQKQEPSLPMELHVIRIGDIAFASNRFELYMDFMHRIQARSPFVQTFVVQLAAVPGPDGGRYLPTERGAWGRGYSASRYCNVVSPKGGQELVDETVATLKEIHAVG